MYIDCGGERLRFKRRDVINGKTRIVYEQASQLSDLTVIVGVVLIVVMMVIPLPPAILDLLLALNMSLSLLLILLTMNVVEPLESDAFPSIVLIMTLFRAALNVSSSRLILLTGNPGKIITAFGQFVVGGNYVVGFVIFLILVIVQFMVITRGAERVAEVAARFTLDAMPGKQMSIDADLNAGLITESEARARRRAVEEADFTVPWMVPPFVKATPLCRLLLR